MTASLLDYRYMAEDRNVFPGTKRKPDPGGEQELTFLLVTTDTSIQDDVALICAVVGGKLECRQSWEGMTAHGWAAMMCTPELLPPAGTLAKDTVLVGRSNQSPESVTLWQAAALRNILHAVPLPEGEAWLSSYLAEVATGQHRGDVAAVCSALGGAGVTTLTYLIGAELAARGKSVLLIDGNPGPGSGVRDIVRNCLAELGEHRENLSSRYLGWSEVTQIEGEISGSQLQASLPAVDGIHMLTQLQEPLERTMLAVDPEVIHAVVTAGRKSFDVVLTDAGQDPALINSLESMLDVLFVVGDASGRCADALYELLDCIDHSQAQLILNGAASSGWRAEEMSAALGLPVALDLPEQKWLKRTQQIHDAYELIRSSRGAKLLQGLLTGSGLDSPQEAMR